MSTFITAIVTHAEPSPRFGNNNHYQGGVVSAGDVHAVANGRVEDWDHLETLCGLPTRDMIPREQSNPSGWPIGKFKRKACATCLHAVEELD